MHQQEAKWKLITPCIQKQTSQGGSMFQIELRFDGKHYVTIAVDTPTTVEEIVGKELIAQKKVIAVTVNTVFQPLQFIPEDTAQIDCITMNSEYGFRIYQDTATFIMMKAFHRLFDRQYILEMEHSVDDGVYAEVFNDYTLSDEDILRLGDEMQRIIDADLPIEKVRMSRDDAEDIFREHHRQDLQNNMHMRHVILNRCEEYYDYFCRELADSTGRIHSFELRYHSPGLILRFPKRGDMHVTGEFNMMRKVFATHQEHDKWLNILGVHHVYHLNRAFHKHEIQELIQVEEALHEKKIVHIAEDIASRKDIKLILIAGPSSSGKTTFAKRLSIQLRVTGIRPHLISMDDYFLSRHLTPRKENGDFDFESIRSLDLDLLNDHLKKVLNGEQIELPKYNFIQGQSQPSGKFLQLRDHDMIIMEGIHGLNDELTRSVPFNQKVKIYVSALNNLNLDSHNRIATTDSRKFRRIIRDFKFRGHTAMQTIDMWDSVREGEDRNIFPYQESADFVFNSILTYELGVIKKYVQPLLEGIRPGQRNYNEAQRLIRILSHFENIHDGIIPSNSILREFVGGSIYEY
jgi:uridine kinase